MGGSDKFVIGQGKDDIIRLQIIGDIDKDDVLKLSSQLNPYLQHLRSRNKKVLALIDQSKTGKIDPGVHEVARSLLKNTDYDRIAMFGANEETLRSARYLLNSLSGVLRIKFFNDEAEALRWLKRGLAPLKRKARRALAWGLGFAGLALFWHFVIAPATLRLPDDFSYSATVISRDNFYDERAASFKGDVVSNTKFDFQAESSKNGVLSIKNSFNVRTASGEEVFGVVRTYGIDKKTRQHVPGHGDHDRRGYLFGPATSGKQDFTYWHINYDAPATMKFQNEENIFGLNTYHYAADYQADQTQELGHLPEVGQSRGVNLDVNLQLWIEPTTGYLVKYEDSTTAYYYDLFSGQRINPWNKFSNSYSFESIAQHVRLAERQKERKSSNEVNTPLFFAFIAAIFFIRWLVLIWRYKVGRLDEYSLLSRFFTVVVVLGLMLTLTVTSWQQTIKETTKLADVQFQGSAHQLQGAIEHEFEDYKKVLQGARGLFSASVQVDRQEWKAYVESLKLSQNYPGILGVGYLQMVPSAEKDAHVAQIRSQGFPEYTIHPAAGHNIYSTVVYIEPFSEENQRAFGYDMSTDATRRKALEAARDSGEPAMSGRVVLRQDSESTEQQYGSVMYLPVYRQGAPLTTNLERRAALLGYVFTSIRTADFVRSVASTRANGLNVELFDAPEVGEQTAGNRMFALDDRYDLDNRAYKPDFTRAESFEVAGHSLVARYASLPSYSRDITLQSLPGFILFVGLMLSFLITAIVFLQGSSRSRALKLAGKMTNDLRTERNIAVTNQSKNEAILSSIGDGVFVIDMSGKIVLFNRAAELISGYGAEEAYDRPYKEVLVFVNEEDDNVVDSFITTALSGKRAEMALHTILKRKDGTTVPVADSAAPIVNAQGIIEGAVVVFRDTTRERQLEHMKDEFLSVASHELRTPMGAVRANIAMILGGDYGPVNKQLVEPLTDMQQSTVRLVELVNDLLDVARIEAGRTKFVLSDFKLGAVVKEAVASLAPLGKERGVPIHVEADVDAMVQGDKDKITQVLTNLIGNSLKFTDRGDIRVSVTVDQGMAEVTVADTGLGISPDDQKKLFTKFKQISSAQDGKPAGTGLGLYISRELIRKMGGDLRIKSSAIGKGSVFAFTLPLAATPSAKRAKQTIDHEAELHPDQK